MIWTLPNILTVARIALTPVIALLPFIQGAGPKLIAFVVFLVAAISDIYDGKLARRRKEVTDLGKLLDPIADKLLLFATLVPIYWITRYPMRQYEIPWWGNLPLWVALLLIGRELFMTGFRWFAKRRGVVIAAQRAGKLKTVIQDVFIGATILWFAWKDLAAERGWRQGWLGALWERIHGTVVAVTLAIAIVITLYSLGHYLYRYRSLFRTSPPPPLDGR
ncbi:MAG TPA: CDP-diacylglycerol--glycerol-3-phosphate 3-phosphatidyltransferase [Gemmatimonadales bacterium]|nr:CDP-diacylglycerol--glycerol-3-phosphate 3-phosphatidyltransferase [Gemmatimonadales bacterium]